LETWEKVLAHASWRLWACDGARSEMVARIRKFLQIETRRGLKHHREGARGHEIVRWRSAVIDLVIRCVLEWASARVGGERAFRGAVLALGGYGRGELAPCSDVDLLFVHEGRASGAFQPFIEMTLHVLWDGGLVVGHSVRSVDESVELARQDVRVCTSLWEARRLWGEAWVVHRLRRRLEADVFEDVRQRRRVLEALREAWDARRTRMGGTALVQEPNVKEGVGGLRDWHVVGWVARIGYGAPSVRAWCAEGMTSGAAYELAHAAYDFLLRVRNEMHFTMGRRVDQLTLDVQPVVAEQLGYRDARGMCASERFMRDYYRHAHELHQFSEGLLERAWTDIHGPVARWDRVERREASRAQASLAAWFSRRRSRARVATFSPDLSHAPEPLFAIVRGHLVLRGDPPPGALWILHAFAVAQREQIPLSDELKWDIRRRLLDGAGDPSRSPEAYRLFLRLLEPRGRVASTLRQMHELGVLVRVVPEFGRITFLVQHDSYHAFTIDEHTLRALEALDRLARRGAAWDPEERRLSELFESVREVVPLYLGVLLHDIGKGQGSGHVPRGVRIAARVSRRLGMDERARQEVVFLVAHHLLMSHVSQRRDVTEESVLAEFIARITEGGRVTDLDQAMERLKRLTLLTYADMKGVGPGVWTRWKGAMLLELYERASEYLQRRLARSTDDAPWGERALEQIARELATEFPTEEVIHHLAQLPERYRRAATPERIAEHLRLIARLSERPVVIRWRLCPERSCTELSVCTFDQRGLFARVAGTLTAHGANILSADVYTRRDGIVIDTFWLTEVGVEQPIGPERWPRIERDLEAAVCGRLDVAAAVRMWRLRARRNRSKTSSRAPLPPIVRCDAEASAHCTVIEVKAEDMPGLAYAVAHALEALGVNIAFAKIATEKNLAFDVFYVTDATGRKLAPARVPLVERAIADAVRALSAPSLQPESAV